MTINLHQNIIHNVCDSAMHIIYGSGLFHTSLWPKNGFKAGFGIGCEVKDRIYYFATTWGQLENPDLGHLQFNIHNTHYNREYKQVMAIKLIMDNAYTNGIYFEDLFPNSVIRDLRFKFTYTPTN